MSNSTVNVYCRNCSISSSKLDSNTELCKSCTSSYTYFCKFREYQQATGKSLLGPEPQGNPLGLKWPNSFRHQDEMRVQYLNTKFKYKGNINYYPDTDEEEGDDL